MTPSMVLLVEKAMVLYAFIAFGVGVYRCRHERFSEMLAGGVLLLLQASALGIGLIAGAYGLWFLFS